MFSTHLNRCCRRDSFQLMRIFHILVNNDTILENRWNSCTGHHLLRCMSVPLASTSRGRRAYLTPVASCGTLSSANSTFASSWRDRISVPGSKRSSSLLFSRRSHIAPQTCTKLHPRSSKVKAIAAFQTAVVIACDPVLPRHRSGHDLLHRHQGILRPRQGRVRPDLRHLPAVSGEVLRRGVKADSKSAVLQHRTALFSLQALGKRRQEVYNTRNRTGKPKKRRQPHVLSGIPGFF